MNTRSNGLFSVFFGKKIYAQLAVNSKGGKRGASRRSDVEFDSTLGYAMHGASDKTWGKEGWLLFLLRYILWSGGIFNFAPPSPLFNPLLLLSPEETSIEFRLGVGGRKRIEEGWKHLFPSSTFWLFLPLSIHRVRSKASTPSFLSFSSLIIRGKVLSSARCTHKKTRGGAENGGMVALIFAAFVHCPSVRWMLYYTYHSFPHNKGKSLRRR